MGEPKNPHELMKVFIGWMQGPHRKITGNQTEIMDHRDRLRDHRDRVQGVGVGMLRGVFLGDLKDSKI